jgi:antirestriction protein ArdC
MFFFNLVEILADVYQLGQHIRQGDIDDAVNLARKLSKHRVQIQGNLGKQHNEERSIPYVKKKIFFLFNKFIVL